MGATTGGEMAEMATTAALERWRAGALLFGERTGTNAEREMDRIV